METSVLKNGVQLNGVQNGVRKSRTIARTAFKISSENGTRTGVQKFGERFKERPFINIAICRKKNISGGIKKQKMHFKKNRL